MNFGYISSIALFSYIFMLMILLAARRNRIANSFIVLLSAMIFWTGGSAFMRELLWPGYRFWYHVSMLGLFMLPFGYYHFITTFAGRQNRLMDCLYFAVFMICFVINIPSGFFLAPPNVVGDGKKVTFIYEINWHIAFLVVLLLVTVSYIFISLFRLIRRRRELRKQFGPIIAGIAILILGQLLIMLPIFKGVPIDIISGMINAVLILFALIKRRLFKLHLLASESLCYAIGVFLDFVLYFNLAPYLNDFLSEKFPQASAYYSLIFAGCFLITALLLAEIWKAVVKNIFIKEEINQAEYLQQYSNNVSKSLRVKEIMEETIDVTKKVTSSAAVYICLKENDGSYCAAYSDQPLSDLNFQIKSSNPLVQYLKKKEAGILIKEFRSSVSYRAMWEAEKQILNNLKIVACVGLYDESDMNGIILLADRKGKKTIDRGTLQMIDSVGSVASIALKNAHLYEKAYYEARTDELTGLLNRKYFSEILNEEFQKNAGGSMSLVILNIDDFKLFNQLYGTRQGDLALKRVAEIIKASVGENGKVARYTGKEFAILLPKYDVYAARNLTDSIRAQIYSMNKGNEEFQMKALTVSAGISATPYAAKTVKELLENVDMAVYHVKHHGKNGVQVFDMVVEDKNGVGESAGRQIGVYQEYESTIYALTAAIDAKDHYTFKHSSRVAYYATELAKAKKLNSDMVEMVRQAALLHDVGKISIPEHILNKNGRLTDEEYEIIKGHVEASIDIIRHLPSLDYVIPAVIGHHERYDGKGYPRRIAGEDIPLTARILCIADSFDAMTSGRCYRAPMEVERALAIITEEAGKQFDPELARLFVACFADETIKIA